MSPRDAVVLGCGRSGTSTVAGLLAEAGWGLGEQLLAPNSDNPKGYFEDLPVNRLNEELLAPVTGEVLRDAGGRPVSARPPAAGERWLTALPEDVALPPRPDLHPQQQALLAGPGPRCRKDPRFTWTLPSWPALAGAVRVVVFREPLAAARSIAAMTAGGTLGLGVEGALAVWAAAGRRALHLAATTGGDWVFVPYAGVLDGTALPGLAAALGVPTLPAAFVDPALRRQPDDGELPGDVADVWDRLRAAAAQAAR